jgi:hypothetical protein
MNKAYSKKAGKEVFVLAPEQLAAFAKYGYKVPKPEEVIADAGAVLIEPPEGTLASVAYDFKTGEFFVRVRTCTLKGNEPAALVGEIIQASITKGMIERADPDRPKAEPTPGISGTAGILNLGSLLQSSLGDALKKILAASSAPPGESEAE